MALTSPELKTASEKLNQETIKQMERCLEELTTSGSPSLDAAVVKKFKRYCRESDDYVRYAFLLVMKQLKRQHSEIRLSAFQVADELFNRSHAFREELVTHLQAFLALTTETESNRPLPPPKSAADKLKTDTLHALQQWYDKYGQGYKKLAVGYDYLKNCRHVDFNDIRAQNLAQRQRAEAAEKKKQKIMADKLTKVLKEISETKFEIENSAKEAESCLQLLMPTPTDFLLPVTDQDANGSVASNKRNYGENNIGEYSGNKSVTQSNESSKNQNKDSNMSSTSSKSESEVIPSNSDLHMHVSQNSTSLTSVSNACTDTYVDKPDECKGSNKITSSLNKTDANGSDLQVARAEKSPERENSTLGKDSKYLESEKKKKDDKEEIREYGEDDCEDMEEEEDGSSDEESEEDLQAHGLTKLSHSLVVELPAPGTVSVKVTEDNTDVVRNLRDASKLINNNYLPTVIRWLEILSKNGAKQSDITAAIDLKVLLETIKAKCVDLKLVSEPVKKIDQDDSDDEEFEEVPEKEGYEPRIPSHLREEYGLSGPSSQKKTEPKAPLKKHASAGPSETPQTLKDQGKSSSCSTYWNLKERIMKETTADPASLATALSKIKSESAASGMDAKTLTSATMSFTPSSSSSAAADNIKTESDGNSIPVVEFGTDLAYWENPDQMEAPTIVKYDSLHRFWAPKEAEAEKPSEHDLAAVRNRVFTYTGKFEPVKWKCRAPLPNGKLCERMDRAKCPFHGRIIARDEQGNPSGAETPSTSKDTDVKMEIDTQDSEDNGQLPPWQDPELQREIEEATGHDLGSARSQKLLEKAAKGKGKGKGKKKHPNLTDIKAIKNTTRKRLENKVFKKGSLKRVCATLDRADYKRVRDKFGNQFNYSLH